MFWFLVAVVFLVLWLNARSAGKAKYSQGYWDGYRAFGDKVKELLDGSSYKKKDLEDLIATGRGEPEPEPTSAPVDLEVQRRVEQYAMSEIDDTETVEEEVVEQQVVTQTVPAPVRSVHVETAAEKERRTLRNLNTILYMASFLFVAAAATFVAAAMSEVVRLAGLIIAVALFYVVGIVLYQRSQRLRSAAIAFVGTGLAILPFIGVALTSLGGVNGSIAWLITSVVGLAAYGYASLVLQSQVVSYLTMAFVLSLASSSVAAASLPIMWYFIVLIGVSLVVSSLSFLWPSVAPAVFRKPIDTTAQIVTPVALVASLLVFNRMTTQMYEVVFGVATAHYLVVWLQTRRFMYETVVRLLAHLTLLVVAFDMVGSGDNLTAFGIGWLVLALAQAAYSFIRVRVANKASCLAEEVWIASMLTAIFIGTIWWVRSDYASFWTTISLLSVGIVSLIAVFRFRAIGWAYVGLFASVLVPFSALHWTVGMPTHWPMIVGYYTLLGCMILRLLSYARQHWSNAIRAFFVTSIITYLVMIILSGVWSDNNVVVGWALASAGTLVATLSYVVRMRSLEVIGVAAACVAIFLWVGESSVDVIWQPTVAILLSAALGGVGTLIHLYLQDDYRRRNSLLILSMGITALLVSNGLSDSNVVIQTSMILFAAGAVGFLVVRWWAQHTSEYMRGILSTGYLGYIISSFILATTQTSSWLTGVLLLAAVIFWLCSHVERTWLFTAVANVAFVAAAYNAWVWLGVPHGWLESFVPLLTGLALCVGYGLYTLRADQPRRLSTLFVIWSLIGWLLLLNQGTGWLTVGFLFAAIVFWVSSHIEHEGEMTAVANIAFAAAVYNVWAWLSLPLEWQATGAMWVSMAVVYAIYWLYGNRRDNIRQWSSLVVVWLLAAIALFGHTGTHGDTANRLLAAVTLLVGLTTVLVQAYLARQGKARATQRLLVGTAITYALVAWLYWMMTNDALVTGFALAIAGGMTVLYSYRAHVIDAEVVGAILGVAAIALWLSELSLGQWYLTATVLVSFACVAIGGAVHYVLGDSSTRRDNLLVVAMMLLGGAVGNVLLGATVEVVRMSFVLLLVAALGSFVMRLVNRNGATHLKHIFTVGYTSYLVLVWAVALQLGDGWLLLAYVAAMIVAWFASHVERVPVLTLGGNLLFAAAIYQFWVWQGFTDYWMVLTIAWATAAVTYSQSWFYVRRNDQFRQQIGLVCSWIPLFGVALVYIDSDVTREIAGAATLIAGAVTVAVQGYITKRKNIIEVAVYIATLGLQRVVSLSIPELNYVFYAHWWAITIWLVAWWRMTDLTTRIVTGVAFITASTGIAALMDGGMYQLLFLVEHLILLVIGALARKQWAVWWGVIASVVAVLYFIKEYVYLWLGLLGLCLVALVVWRLVKLGNNQSHQDK